MCYLTWPFADGHMFWILQSVIIASAVVLFIKDGIATYRSRGGFKKKENNVTLTITRDHSTVIFYRVLFGAVSGFLIGICIFVDVIEGYRIIWMLIDIILPLYIFIFNHWTRNKLSVLHSYLHEVEKR